MSFIYKYKTSTLTPFVKPCDILNLAIQNIFYTQLYVESAFTYNPGSTLQEPWHKLLGGVRVPTGISDSITATSEEVGIYKNKCIVWR